MIKIFANKMVRCGTVNAFSGLWVPEGCGTPDRYPWILGLLNSERRGRRVQVRVDSGGKSQGRGRLVPNHRFSGATGSVVVDVFVWVVGRSRRWRAFRTPIGIPPDSKWAWGISQMKALWHSPFLYKESWPSVPLVLWALSQAHSLILQPQVSICGR